MTNRVHLMLLSLVLPVTALAAAPPEARELRRTPVVEVFEAARDAVVNISSTEVVDVRDPFDRFFEGFFDTPFRSRPRQLRRTSIGSGFVIHPDGYIVTNAHVVARSTDRTVTFADGREYDAAVVASDRESDVAVLKIEVSESLTTLPFGRSGDLMVGETVVAIGNPLGYQHTVTAGVVSAVDRDLELSRDVAMEGLIQTDASINPGNSGGPLLNVLGELIGVNTAIRGDAQNIGFAIPVDRLRTLLPGLLDVERRYRIRIGLELSAESRPVVASVEPGSPAERAGIAAGDVLVSVDGRPVTEVVDFHIALIGVSAGEEVELGLRRDGRAVRATLVPEGRPKPDAERLARRRLGIEVQPLPEKLARELGLPRGGGFVVIGVDPGGPAEALGMRPRDVLVALGRHYPTTPDELGELLEYLEPGQQVSVTWLRVRPPAVVRYHDALRVR